MTISRILALALLFCPAAAWAQAPTPAEICAKHDPDNTACVQELTELQGLLGEGHWRQFATCALAAENQDATAQCVTQDMIETMLDQEVEEPGIPAGPAPTIQEICTKHDPDTPECPEQLAEIQSMLGETYWPPFAHCVLASPNRDATEVCFTDDMKEYLMAQMRGDAHGHAPEPKEIPVPSGPPATAEQICAKHDADNPECVSELNTLKDMLNDPAMWDTFSGCAFAAPTKEATEVCVTEELLKKLIESQEPQQP